MLRRWRRLCNSSGGCRSSGYDSVPAPPAPLLRTLGGPAAAATRRSAATAASHNQAPIRVLVAGGGVAGCIIASQLLRTPGIEVSIVERRSAGELPRGLNLLLNHNGMAALADIDASLEAALRSIGTDTVGWSARMMTGELLYELADVQEEGLADTPGLVGRWDEVNATLQAACGVDQIRFGTAVSSWEYAPPENPGALRVHLEEETVDDSAAAAAQGSGGGGGTRTIVEVNRETRRLMWLLVFVFIESLSR